jgi:hypothetical protein
VGLLARKAGAGGGTGGRERAMTDAAFAWMGIVLLVGCACILSSGLERGLVLSIGVAFTLFSVLFPLLVWFSNQG